MQSFPPSSTRMFGQVFLLMCCLVAGAKTWSQVRNPFELPKSPETFHPITECMHVVSEEGNYSFKKSPQPAGRDAISAADSAVCGLYVVGDADTVVEFTIKYMHVSCESGGLMAFVDGWELNGEYFPSLHDHQLPLERRVVEFCGTSSGPGSSSGHYFGAAAGGPRLFGPSSGQAEKGRLAGRVFRSHQNAALLQYRIPVRGAFVVSVRFVSNRKPCHIMSEGVAPFYVLRNYGERSNCTLTALYPAVVEVKALSIGGAPPADTINFNCGNNADRIDIGGSSGLESAGMEVASAACGTTPATQTPNKEVAPNGQAIFCGVTTVRLVSSGRSANTATIALRPAGEVDMSIAMLLCEL